MKHIIVLLSGFSLLFGASIVSAQTYTSFYNVVNTGACANLTSDLTVGSKGTQVRNLQIFLVAQNYPGGGSWMITGNYGQATQVAVRNFQQQSGLPITSWVDYATRTAINQASCLMTGQGGGGYNYNPYSNNYGYNYNNPYNNYWYTNPTYPTYPNPSIPTGGISISSLSPNSGVVGSTVTVTGSGFSTAGNSVRFGNGVIANLHSQDGRTLTFAVPSEISGYGYQPITLGLYYVSARNSAGQTSNTLPFNITALSGGGTTIGAPTITGVSGPTLLAVNTQGTWTLTINNNQTNSYTVTSVNWGDQSLSPNQTTYVQGTQTVTFNHMFTTAGTRTITFTVTGVNGLSNTTSVTVTVQ